MVFGILRVWSGAASLVTEEPYAGVAVSVTEIADICSCWSVCAGDHLSFGPLLFRCLRQFVFPCREVLLYGASPSCAVRCKGFPGLCVDVEVSHVSFQNIAVAQVWTTCFSPPTCQFSIEEVFGDATVLHPMHMAQPAQPALSELCVQAGEASTCQDIDVAHFVLPGYAQDAAETSQVEGVESPLLPGIGCPHLAAIQ